MPGERRRRTGLTGAGRWFAVAAATGIVGGRVVGVAEVAMAGTALAVLLVAAHLVVRAAGTDLAVRRDVRPHRVEVGEHFAVTLRVHNGRSVVRPPLTVTDALGDRRVARLVLAQSHRDPAAVADYRVTATRRGVTSFGDVTIGLTDPFGLVQARVVTGDPVDVIVLPRRIALEMAPPAGAEDPTGGPRHRRITATVSEEFDSLREYVPGDDVRRVHWASTARLGRPLVRTHQQPAQRRTTVVIDDLAATWAGTDPEALERAVVAAASALTSASAAGDVVRLLFAGGDDTGAVDDERRVEVAVDRLAALTPSSGGSLRGALDHADGERIVVCTAAATAETLGVVAASASRRGEHTVIVTADTPGGSGAPGAAGAPATTTGPAAGRVTVVRYGSNDDLATGWRQAFATSAGLA